jgi:hypothetical protein
MSERIDDQKTMTAYLLGELSEEEQFRLESEYFTNSEKYEQLLAIEDELTYDYLQGRLSPGQRRHFDQTIGATERGQSNLQFAGSLLQVLRADDALLRSSSRQRSILQWAPAIAAAVALIALPLWMAVRLARMDADVEKIRADAAASQARLQQDLAAAKSARKAEPLSVSFLLAPGMSRSEGGPPRLELSAAAEVIRFELILPPDTRPGDYVVTISNVNGGQVWSHSVAASGRSIVQIAPAGLFPSGDYEVGVRRMTAGEQLPDLANYSFRLLRK